MIQFKTGDFFIILLLAAVSFYLFRVIHVSKGDTVTINADGKLYEYSLSKNAEYKVEGAIGTTTVLVHDGKVRITDSPCKNKTCVHQKDADTIICLPNKVIVKVNDSGEAFDGISQ
jgi:hypothetical protein